MEFLKDLTGSLLWATVLGVVIYAASSIAIGFLAKKSTLLKPVGSGLNLIALFVAVQVFLHFGAAEYYPRMSRQLDFFSWLVFTFAVLKLGLYLYGDLFVVRWKRGSFPAAFKNIITALVIVVVALILLKEILNINVTSLIATTTVLTATIGLAFQSTLANMLAGLTIHLEKPLRQGDWISAGGHEGRVMDITLRSTRIMTIEHNEVFIPNSKVLSEAVVNYSLPNTLQTRKLSVGVNYNVPPNKVRNVILEVLGAVKGVNQHPEPVIRVTNYGDFAVHYEIRYTISDFARHVDLEAEIMNLLWYRFKRSGIDIPMPVRDINLRQVTPESLQADKERHAGEILVLMEKVEILSPLSKPELHKLVRQVRSETYSAGEVPVKQGERGDSFYIIKSGRVDVIVEKTAGEFAVVASLGPGNFFGEMSLLTGAVRTASIHVKEDAEFIVIDKESFGSTLANNPSIAESLSHILSERQASLDAERERLDTAALERRKREASGRMLSRIRDFFGLAQ
jgi:small-conductance mechanosensitive channel/CRP-like cAMP-binding protein